MTDDDEMKELERRMTAKLFGGGSRTPTVEVRRSHDKPKPVVEVKATIRPLSDPGDEAFVVSFHAVNPDGKRAHLRTIRVMDPSGYRHIIREYEEEGRTIRWIGKRPEDYTEKDFDKAWQ